MTNADDPLVRWLTKRRDIRKAKRERAKKIENKIKHGAAVAQINAILDWISKHPQGEAR